MSGSPRRHDEAPARWHAPRPENYRHTLTCVAYRAAPLAASGCANEKPAGAAGGLGNGGADRLRRPAPVTSDLNRRSTDDPKFYRR